MSLSTKPYKGARDFYPEDKRLQKYLFNVMRQVCERYGYEEYDAPILEPTELFASKTSDEIVNEQTYSFADRGGRNVTIRTEMTPTVSRMVAAKRQELAYPARWYSIPNLWRYERMQRGRLREFWQLNVDIFGVENLSAEEEVIQLADELMQAYGAKRNMYTIKLSSRKLINTFLTESLGLDETQSGTMIRLIDRMQKMERAEFVAKIDVVFSPSQRKAGASEQLFAFLDAKSIDELPPTAAAYPAAQELKQLMGRLSADKISNIVFDPSLMRGFDYYTDIVFEVFDTDPDNNRSMFGGGRYDGLVELFGVEAVPAVGFAMGDVTLTNFLEAHGLLPEPPVETDVYIVPIGDSLPAAMKVAQELRQMGLNIALDNSGRKADKQIKAAVKKGIRYVLFVGEKELSDEIFTLKDLQAGSEERLALQRVVSTVKDFRKK
ncbi:MAG TPA: histidine--tRNA ligase [Candidatus Saccharimonadales bacterium]|nr:histidine--tRNA ligase [Candidatus Saccharimonadales bacterium]